MMGGTVETWDSCVEAILWQHDHGNSSADWMADALRGLLELFGSPELARQPATE